MFVISIEKIKASTLARAISILPRRDRKRIVAVAILQVCLGFLDLAGVAVIGVIGALAINGVAATEPGNRVGALLEFLHLDSFNLQTQTFILGISAAILLIGKTVISIIFTRRMLYFLSRRAAVLSANLVSRLLSQSLLTVQSKSLQQMMYSVTGGVSVVTVSVLGTAITMVSDLSLLMVMGIGLLVVDPIVAISTFLAFTLVAIALYRLMHVKAERLGNKQAELSISSSEKIYEVIVAFREMVVRNRRNYYARTIGKQRHLLSDTTAELAFMPNIAKYVIEITVILGALVMCAIQFATSNAAHAVAVLSIFLAATTRIAPAVLRIQNGAISLRGSIGAARPTLELIEQLGSVEETQNTDDVLRDSHEGFESSIQITDLSFTYPEKDLPAISNLNLRINPGTIVAIVGPSGAGKTTLVDLLLGVLPIQEGSIKISGFNPQETIQRWPGAIAYVPQDVSVGNGTIRESISMGYPVEAASDKRVYEAIDIAQLRDFVNALDLGVDTSTGDRGTKMSGGQRQRIGIARAMFTKPKLLVLDEATSSLDGATEANLSDAIQSMRGEVTILMIAHRLSTVRNSDLVIYLSEGRLVASGTFEEVRLAVPDFDHQATLMGL
jgi:ABC-type multidrug transport system fused ATPase/permease subunit